MSTVFLTNIDGRGWNAAIRNGMLLELGPGRPAARRNQFDAQGASLIPALHDHHVHLRAAAARTWSVDLTGIRCHDKARALLHNARPGPDGWVRAVGYDEVHLGALTRHGLDGLYPQDHPLKVQHRGGHLWAVNSAGRGVLLRAGAQVRQDGTLWDDDRSMTRGATARDAVMTAVARIGADIAGQGCLAVTDMTAGQSSADIAALRHACAPQLTVDGYGDDTAIHMPRKIVITDHALPDPDAVARMLAGPAPVAVHAVSREAAALLASLNGPLGPRVRVEHGFVLDAGLIALLAEHRVQMGVQPGFIHTRGDGLQDSMPPAELQDYQRLRSLMRAGLTLFGGTDRPFSTGDIWQAMAAAVSRRTRSGRIIGPHEALQPEEAFALFTPAGLTGEADIPQVRCGQAGGICLLDRSWNRARADLAQTRVRAVFRPVPPDRDPETNIASPGANRRSSVSREEHADA